MLILQHLVSVNYVNCVGLDRICRLLHRSTLYSSYICECLQASFGKSAAIFRQRYLHIPVIFVYLLIYTKLDQSGHNADLVCFLQGCQDPAAVTFNVTSTMTYNTHFTNTLHIAS